jgi:hypothetical protein
VILKWVKFKLTCYSIKCSWNLLCWKTHSNRIYWAESELVEDRIHLLLSGSSDNQNYSASIDYKEASPFPAMSDSVRNQIYSQIYVSLSSNLYFANLLFIFLSPEDQSRNEQKTYFKQDQSHQEVFSFY